MRDCERKGRREGADFELRDEREVERVRNLDTQTCEDSVVLDEIFRHGHRSSLLSSRELLRFSSTFFRADKMTARECAIRIASLTFVRVKHNE